MEQLNHQTTKLSNHQTIFSHKEHKEHKEQKVEATMSNHQANSDERRVTSDEFAVENHQTAKRPNHQTIFSHKGHKEHKGGWKDGTMNHQTTKLTNHQTISGQLGRWAAVAAVAAGAWLESARDAEIAA